MQAKLFAPVAPQLGQSLGKAKSMGFEEPLRPQIASRKHRTSVGSWRRLTVKDRACEKHQKLNEQVLLLGGNLVPAEALPPTLDIAIADALLDVGIKPLFRYGAVFLGGFLLLAPEL